jgi:sirohydrochlorin cobaltochelatase
MTSSWSDAALVLVGHGSSTLQDASFPTRALARIIREAGLFAEVACCFHKEPPALADGLSLVRSRRVFVVPNFIGEGYYTRDLIPRAMGLSGSLTVLAGAGGQRIVHYARPVGTHPRVASLIADRAARHANEMGWTTEQSSLLLIGHGSARPGGAATTPEAIAAAIRAQGRFAEVKTAFLEQSPFARDWRDIVTSRQVLVAPLLVSQGLHASRDLPALFNAPATGTAEAFRTALCPLLGTEPAMMDLVLDKVREAEGSSP